jgi:hypothetical protein
MRLSSRAAALARGLVPVAALMAATLAPAAQAGAAGSHKIKALVPAYFHPAFQSSEWQALTCAASLIPVEAIINPDSGPGPELDVDYALAVFNLQEAGGKAIGYVSTGFGARDYDAVIGDVESYLDWYGVDGIFLDEMSNGAGDLDYEAVYAYIKSRAGELGRDLHVVGNPGNPFGWVEAFLEAADTLVVFEGPLFTQPTEAVLDFEEIPIPDPSGGAFISGSYASQGFQLTAIAPNGFLSSYFARDERSGGFYAGSKAIGATTEATITLTRPDARPFSLASIDVARYFIFNGGNDPVTLTFVGQRAGGGTVQQTFTVQTAVGVPAFDTFTLSGFTNLTSVSWQQEFGPDGVKHQFDNLRLGFTPVGANFAEYPTAGPYTGLVRWFESYPSRRIANLVFDVPSVGYMMAALVKAGRYNAGYIYLTDDDLPNPWDSLPWYWELEVAAIRIYNALKL